MRIVREVEARVDHQLFDRLWQERTTFILVPSNLSLTEDWIVASVALIPAEYRRDHFVLMTSGSTGQPKLIVASKDRAERLAAAIHAAQDDEPARETIACLPLSYSYAFVNQWVWSYHLRRRLVPTEGFTRPAELKAVFDAADAAMTCMVGIQVPLLRQLFGTHRFPGVLRLNFAGGRFPQEHLDALHHIFPNARIFNNYGCAEAMPRLTIRGAEDSDSAANIGSPLPGIELRSGADDQLEFRSPYRAVAVVEGERFRPLDDSEWMVTGDLGRAAENGSWLLLGRNSEVFKRFGEKISLPALHAAVQRVWTGELAFYRVTDSLGENAHVMVLAPRPAREQLRTILAELRHDFTRPHWPFRIESRDQLPRLPSTKVDTRALSEPGGVTVEWRQKY